MFSRVDLARAVQFIARGVDRVEVFFDPERAVARVFVSTGELESVTGAAFEAVCDVCRDFVPPAIVVEVVTVTEPTILRTVANVP